MKLAEALILRSDYQNKIFELRERIQNNVKVQEGEEVAENPIELFTVLKDTLSNLEQLVIRINKTNATIMFDNQQTLSDLITKRDTIKKKINLYTSILNQANVKYDRMTRTEIKYVTTINIAALQKEIDDLSKAFRELDVKLQEKNWTTELL
ncbi:MAG: hypothetical protein E7231_16320 [Cellulosilyticum sp.]|nr:hypothetical protein [Cellulosilyticum sp.]